MTRPEALKVVSILLNAYPNAKATVNTPSVYATMLEDLDYAAVNAAVHRLLATAKFLPTIAEIREAVLEVAQGGKRSGAEAWGDVLKAVGRYGRDRVPVFADPYVTLAVEAVGWRAICLSEETDPAPRAKFADAYNALATRDRKELQIASGADGGERLIAGVARKLTLVKGDDE